MAEDKISGLLGNNCRASNYMDPQIAFSGPPDQSWVAFRLGVI